MRTRFIPRKKRENLDEQLQLVYAEAFGLANKLGNTEKKSILCVWYINEKNISKQHFRNGQRTLKKTSMLNIHYEIIASVNKKADIINDKWNHVMSLPAYFHCELIRWKSLCRNRRRRWGFFTVENGSTIGSVVVAMSRNQLTESAVVAMHRDTIPILKTDISKAYMSIHSHRMATSSLFNDAWFIKYLLYFVGYWLYDTDT